MHEKLILTTGTFALWATFGAEAKGTIFELRWMICAMVVMTLIDFYWGTRESLAKGDKWHFSRAGRRTLTKNIEYMTYLLLGCVVGYSTTEPLGIANHITTSAVGLAFGMAFDLNSIIGHVLQVKGVSVKFNLWLFLLGMLKHQKEEVAEAIEGAITNKDNEADNSGTTTEQE